MNTRVSSAPDRIRTCDLRFRRPTLYPAELRAPVRPRIATRPGPSPCGAEAERAGFEPAMGFKPHTRLAGECLQPLGHLSRGERSVYRRCRPGRVDLEPHDGAVGVAFGAPRVGQAGDELEPHPALAGDRRR